jgi:hypothetical protein
MTLAADPFAPDRDLSVNELRSGFGYGSGVSYVGGVPNPAGVRSGVVTICSTAADLTTALAAASYGDDIVLKAGDTYTGSFAVSVSPASITAATPRQAPPPMMAYTSAVGLAIQAPVAMASAPAALTAPNVPVTAMASVIVQGDPSYIRLMSSQAHQVTTPPPHTSWHVTNNSHFAVMTPTVSGLMWGTSDGLASGTYHNYHHWRAEGIRFVAPTQNSSGFFLLWGSANGSPAQTDAPHHIVFDRCYVDGDNSGTSVIPQNFRNGGYGLQKGILAHCDFFGYLNGRVSGCASDNYLNECNAIYGDGGLGPQHLENNWLSGSGQCIFWNNNHHFGFPYPYLIGNHTILRNWIIRPLSWFPATRATITETSGSANTIAFDATGQIGTLASAGSGGNTVGANGDAWQTTDFFYETTVGRPVALVSSSNGTTNFVIASPGYPEFASLSGRSGVVLNGNACLDGTTGSTVTLSGAGNRTVTGVNTRWLTTLQPAVASPPPGCGVFFGVNSNVSITSGASNNQNWAPRMRLIASIESDTQLTLAEDYTAGTWTAVYYTAAYWDGFARAVMKNLHEMKGTNRLRAVGNVYENAWDTFNGQGSDILSQNTASYQYTRDAYYGYNLLINGGLAHYVTGFDFVQNGPPEDPTLAATQRVCLEHNLGVDLFNMRWNRNFSKQLFNDSSSKNEAGLNPGGFGGAGGNPGSGVNNYQFRHNTAILSTDYIGWYRTILADLQGGVPLATAHTFRDSIVYVGDHGGTFANSGGYYTVSDSLDADGALVSDVTTDSIVAYNVYLRNKAVTVAAHTVNYGAVNAGYLNESSVAFATFGNAANIPRWLTQSIVASDYALTTIYQTPAAACTVTASTVTISSGTIPNTVGLGTPFRVLGDGVIALGRVSSRDSATQVTLTANYAGTTGAGLTGLFSFVGAASDGTSSTVYDTNTAAATVSNITSVTVNESFTHANEAGLGGIDNTWVLAFGTAFGITSNAAALQATTASRNVAICQTTLRSPDHFASCVLAVYTQTSNAQGGVCARSNATGTSTYFFHAAPTSGNQFEFGTITNGVSSTVATFNSTTAVAGQGLKLTVTGSTYTCEINNSAVMTGTNTAITTGNYAGIEGFRGAGGDAVSLDTFTAQTTTPIAVSLVNLVTGQFPVTVTPSTLFPRQFYVTADGTVDATSVANYDSATQIALSTTYPGTTGAGLTGKIIGTIPSGQDPGCNTTAVLAAVSGIRT